MHILPVHNLEHSDGRRATSNRQPNYCLGPYRWASLVLLPIAASKNLCVASCRGFVVGSRVILSSSIDHWLRPIRKCVAHQPQE